MVAIASGGTIGNYSKQETFGVLRRSIEANALIERVYGSTALDLDEEVERLPSEDALVTGKAPQVASGFDSSGAPPRDRKASSDFPWYVFVSTLLLASCAGAVVFLRSGWSARRTVASEAAARVPGEFKDLFARHEGFRRRVHTLRPFEIESITGSRVEGARLLGMGAGGAELGLDAAAAELLLRAFGRNRLTPPEAENMWLALGRQIFLGLFNVLLWFCVLVQGVLAAIAGDEWVTPAVLALVIVGSGTLQWWTELQAQLVIDSLIGMQASGDVLVFRCGQASPVPISPDLLLPGDVMVLEAGQQVPADLRVLDCTDNALVENAALTGESLAEPRVAALAPEGQPLIEAKNILFSGTSVVSGRLLCIVFATGDQTMLGEIAGKITNARTRSSLEHQIEHFVHIIAFVAIFVGVLTLWSNMASPHKKDTLSIFRTTATAIFCQVPEGLLPTVTAVLMISARQMAARRVLVRRMDAVESLGCISVLCSDKTGTLTSGQMTATDFVVPTSDPTRALLRVGTNEPASEALEPLALCGLLNSTATSREGDAVAGTPTEVAILEACRAVLAAKGSIEALRAASPQVFEIPFSSVTKHMLTIHANETFFRLIVKGAPEQVLQLCKLSQCLQDAIDKELHELMAVGKRVLCFADLELRNVPKDFRFRGASLDDANFKVRDLEFRGLVAIEDPPKRGVPEAVADLLAAGVRTVMVTGDHPATAAAIADRIGILHGVGKQDPFVIVSGERLDSFELREDETFDALLLTCGGRAAPGSAMAAALAEARGTSPAERRLQFWRSCVEHTRVFARVSPIHKQSIVRAYQQLGGHVVGMTGDGVNDAPALKAAEVGIAMGIRGTEVAKEAADLLLLDDDLSSVVVGVEQGRLCAENLRKSVAYTLCSKVPQLLPSMFEAFGWPLALTALEVLLIDIGTDIWTAIAYAWQPAESSLMTNAPRHPVKDRMVNKQLLVYSYIYMGLLQSIMCWVLFTCMPLMLDLIARKKEVTSYTEEEVAATRCASTMYYWTLVCGQVAAGLATTTTRQSILGYGLPNMCLNLLIVAEIAFSLCVIYVESLNRMLGTLPLEYQQCLRALSAILFILSVEEVRKWVVRRYEGGLQTS